MRALITGGAGFVGQWAARTLLERGYEVVSAGHPSIATSQVLTGAERARISWAQLDIRDQGAIGALLDATRPEVIMHLAGVSFVPDATDAPSRAYDVNILGFGRLISEIMVRRRAGGIDPTVLVVGSAEQYGRHDADAMPLDEETVQRPLTVYAASKAAQEVLALQAWRSEGVRVIATRSFNHSGVGHAAHFLIPALVSRTLRMRRQGAAALSIGNGDVIRDFTHVADVAEAYARLVEQGQPGEVYNVCCGEGTSVRTLAERILHRVGLPPEIAIDPALVRRVDVPALVGSNAKLRRDTAWAPARTLDDIIDDLIHAATH